MILNFLGMIQLVLPRYFFNSSKLGKNYENDVFVSDIHHGRIFHFKMNANRTSLALQGPLVDRVADTGNETNGLIFGSITVAYQIWKLVRMVTCT